MGEFRILKNGGETEFIVERKGLFGWWPINEADEFGWHPIRFKSQTSAQEWVDRNVADGQWSVCEQ